ncbi:MAG TPA: cation transporter, partial [Gaiellaceae bacterium]|nr:cation transporter [Gaiellaceae bacterium]
MSATAGPLERLDLPVEGMTCASCAVRIEKRLNTLEGVEATVNFATETASVEYDPACATPDELLGAVESAGYHASLPAEPGEEAAEAPHDPARDLRIRLLVSAALSLPVLLLAMIPPLQFDYWQWLSLQ